MPRDHRLLEGSSNKARERECVDRRYSEKLFNYSADELNNTVVWTHKACVCNELVALKLRHQVDDGLRESIPMHNISKPLEKMLGRVRPWSREAICDLYRGTKRRDMDAAKASLEIEGLDWNKDTKLRMFLKADKYHSSKMKAPRCIQFRSKKFALEYARFIHPLEKMVYEALRNDNGVRFIAKGRNSYQRAEDLREAWEYYSNPIAISGDFKAMDAHETQAKLKEYARGVSAGLDKQDRRRFLRLFNVLLSHKGSTRNGTTYKTTGTGASGEQDTALKNCWIALMLLVDLLKRLGIKGTIYLDGDDWVIITEDCDAGRVTASCFAQYGMEVTIDLSREFETIDFCQCRPVHDGTVWRMVRNPERVLARLPWIVRPLPQNCHDRYKRSIGMCELAMSSGLPVMQSIAERLIECSTKRYMITDYHLRAVAEGLDPCKARSRPVTAEARQSFERAWGVSVDQQLAWERMQLTMPVIDLSAYEAVGGERPYSG